MNVVSTAGGQRLPLGRVLGRGGEGTVYHVDGHGDLAVKLYTDGKAAQRSDKIWTMVAAGYHRLTDFVAFPVDVVLDAAGGFAGFTMRKVSGVKPIHELYAPGSRKSEFSNADFRFLTRTALNFAKAVASIHQAGCVVGDINHSGILVSDRATVTLIDSDSFQIRSGTKVYRCRVGVGEYTPAELQGKSLEGIDRTVAHDAFGVAVIIFQLLFMGKHPFAGRYSGSGDMPIEKAIGEGRFAYSQTRKVQTAMEPPPFALGMADLPPSVATAFERAFQPLGTRPTPAEWVAVLADAETGLVDCRINPVHQHPRNAASCPWCRIEGGAGIMLFLPKAGASAAPSATSFDLVRAVAAIDRVAPPGPAPDPATLMPAMADLRRSEAARAARAGKRNRKLGGMAVCALAVLLMASGLPIAFFGLVWGGVLLFGDGKAASVLVDRRRGAAADWERIKGQWSTEAGQARFDAKREELRRLSDEHGRLPATEAARLADLDRKKRDTQLRAHLEHHPIARAKIKGIGEGRKATLASFNVEDAGDVTRSNIQRVPGFGESLTRTMLDWRQSVERKFVFNPALPTDPVAIGRVRADIAKRRGEIEQALLRGPVDLQQIAAHSLSLRASPGAALVEAHRSLRQAEMDVGS